MMTTSLKFGAVLIKPGSVDKLREKADSLGVEPRVFEVLQNGPDTTPPPKTGDKKQDRKARKQWKRESKRRWNVDGYHQGLLHRDLRAKVQAIHEQNQKKQAFIDGTHVASWLFRENDHKVFGCRPVKEEYAGSIVLLTRADCKPRENPLAGFNDGHYDPRNLPYKSKHADQKAILSLLNSAGFQEETDYEVNPFAEIYAQITEDKTRKKAKKRD